MTIDEFFGYLSVYRTKWDVGTEKKIRGHVDGQGKCCPLTYLCWKKTGEWILPVDYRKAGKKLGLCESGITYLFYAIDDLNGGNPIVMSLVDRLRVVCGLGDVNDS